MSKIIVTEFISLDGVIEEPHLWHFPFFKEEAQDYKLNELRATDALLLGRKTYEGFAEAWPNMSGDEFSDKFNTMPKHVVSTTITDPQWTNSHIVGSNLAVELATLKDSYQQDIFIHGSGNLANSLLRQGLIDEIRLMVHPIVVGKGQKFFDDGTSVASLTLVDARPFDATTLLLTYRPEHSNTDG